MILITLGTQKFQCNRLLRAIDQLVHTKRIEEEIYAQIGFSDYRPQYFPFCKFLDANRFEEIIEKSDLIITHSGVGTIIDALKRKKKVLVYPRLQKYQEHVDDHQIEIGEAFESRGLVVCCQEKDNLLEKIEEARNLVVKEFHSDQERMINLIEQFLIENQDYKS